MGPKASADTSGMTDRKRKPSRKPTAARLLDVAERLFARHGIDAVSLRQIGVAAGSSNHFVVQYHFGDKASLLRAIFERRLPDLEQRRARLLDGAERAGLAKDPRTLLEILLRPVADQTDADGRCSYAAFLLGLDRQGQGSLRREASAAAPLTSALFSLLATSNPAVPVEVARRRMRSVFNMFLDALQACDDVVADGERSPEKAAILEDALQMAVQAFTAPPPPERDANPPIAEMR